MPRDKNVVFISALIDCPACGSSHEARVKVNYSVNALDYFCHKTREEVLSLAQENLIDLIKLNEGEVK